MKSVRLMAVTVLAAGMALATSGFAQNAAPGAQTPQAQGAAGSATGTWTAEQLMTSSVHDAWVMSGKNEQTFFQMVSQLAQIAAQKRGLTLPDSEEAGKRFGQLIKTMAKADHDQLLYVVVDKAVQQVGTKS
jgi:basic membrane lipoprotein Med (substrate-binding protein (PBP1-ABC) superfamily)